MLTAPKFQYRIVRCYQEDARADAEEKFYQDTLNKELQLNVEYRTGNVEAVTLLYKDSKEDVGQSLVAEGLVTVEKRKEKRLVKLVGDYTRSQEKAKQAHVSFFCLFYCNYASTNRFEFVSHES